MAGLTCPVTGQVLIEFPYVAGTVPGATLTNRRDDMVQAFREDAIY